MAGISIELVIFWISIIGSNLIGDFPIEYKKINMVNTPSLVNATNPHNMYILVLVQLGLLGLVSLMSIFYYQMKFSFYASNRLIRDVGFTLPALFLVIMWSDSYLLGHYTTLMFVFFSSFFSFLTIPYFHFSQI